MCVQVRDKPIKPNVFWTIFHERFNNATLTSFSDAVLKKAITVTFAFVGYVSPDINLFKYKPVFI